MTKNLAGHARPRNAGPQPSDPFCNWCGYHDMSVRFRANLLTSVCARCAESPRGRHRRVESTWRTLMTSWWR